MIILKVLNLLAQVAIQKSNTSNTSFLHFMGCIVWLDNLLKLKVICIKVYNIVNGKKIS